MISHLCLLGALIYFHAAGGQGNLIPKIQKDIRVAMSSRWRDFYASRAIDGNENTAADSCKCCSATNGGQSWWRLNLGKQYLIKTIIFLGRTDGNAGSQSRGFSIYNGFSNSTGKELLNRNTATTGHNFTINLIPHVALQHLEVSKSDVLTICELKLEEEECSSGYFGYPCQSCGYCDDSGICDPTTGMCPNGCQSGYTGTLCKQQCLDGTFGQNCESICHCQNNVTCNHTNGRCPGDVCAPGWKSRDCNTECDDGTFGQDCQKKCHCREQIPCEKVFGVCSSGQCANGWKGNTCSTKCLDGTFGQKCESICHCQNNVTCNHTNGRCPGDVCAPGWKSWDCNIECDDGTFGQNCQNKCHCRDGMPCEKVNGVCFSGQCANGWKGNTCSTKCLDGKYGQNCESICHCQNNVPCNHTNGNCPDNLCAPGWKGLYCNTECDDGTFGLKCQNDCHCRDQIPCEKVNGTCSSGQCSNGWKGSSCSSECDEGTFGLNCSSVCHCQNNATCAHENGRCPDDLCAPGWTGYDCNTVCDDGTFGQGCHSKCHCQDQMTCDKISGICASGPCESGWIGNNCSTECDKGNFGLNCTSVCHCQNNATCDHENGTCPDDLCAPGWREYDCNTECDDGTFGQGCHSECHCRDQGTCDKIIGICTSGLCESGWIGNNCSIECYEGTFGQNCSFACHCQNDETCNHVNGSCPSNDCAPGWKETDCNTECDDGTFGQNCESTCHCLEPEVCNKISGSCLSGLCAKGWRGARCNTGCSDGSFGQNCSWICHCFENVTCDHVSGVCPDGRCASGWTESDCNTVAEAIKIPEEGPPTGAIVGAVVGVLVLSLIVVVIVVIRYRKWNSQPKPRLNQENFSELVEKKECGKTASKKLQQNRQQRKQINDIIGKDAVDVGTDHTYYAFEDSQAKRIPVHEIWDYIRLAHNNNCEKLHQEFQKLPCGLVHDCNEARRPENANKTRYKQMFAYDHSRVVLKRDDPNDSTYINASYINGYRKTRKFIASQGPMDAMVGDFWEMVIQENTSIIIMLTNAVEHRVIKCIQYWPSSENERLTFGDVTVLTSKIHTHPDYTIRELDISEEGGTPKRITQYHFTAWPDKDVPDAAWHLVNFWRKVNSVVQTIKEPVVVHCSAGIGRTGTFIGLDNLHAQAKSEGYIQPFDMITRLRHQRVNMVQTKFQYVFLHEAVAEALYIGVKPVKVNEFDAVYKILQEPTNTTGITGLEQQHRLIKEKPIITDEASEYCKVTPSTEYDAYRPKGMAASSSGNGNDLELDMCYVHNYDGKDTFIVTRTSNEGTVETLWKMIEKHNIKTVITLFDENDRAETVLDKYNHEQRENSHSKGAVQLTETTNQKHYIEKTFTAIPNKSDKESRNIKQFMFLAMKDKPTNTDAVVSLLNAIQRWQPSVDKSQPILITHENAFERCGLMCLLLSEFDRVRTKEEVNIVATMMHLKDKNPQLIPNYEQYKLCYSAVLEYIRQSDVYMNV